MKSTTGLVSDRSASPIQAFPLIQGGLNITSADGAQSNVILIHCVVAGTITILWDDGASDLITVEDNQDFTVTPNVASITVTSGTFHLA